MPIRDQIRKDLGFASESELRKGMYNTWIELGLIQDFGKERLRG
jgi:hypothetical protein